MLKVTKKVFNQGKPNIPNQDKDKLLFYKDVINTISLWYI